MISIFVVLRMIFDSGCLWLSGITGSIAYNWSRPNMKTSVKIIHARLVIISVRLVYTCWLNMINWVRHANCAIRGFDTEEKCLWFWCGSVFLFEPLVCVVLTECYDCFDVLLIWFVSSSPVVGTCILFPLFSTSV